MQWIKDYWLPALIGFGAGLVVMMLLVGSPARAADLGGNCCADLEERIAELEVTTARKGNRKVTLTVSGVVNSALFYFDAGDLSDTRILNNGTDETRVSFAGAARITADWMAGFNLTLEARQLGLLNTGVTSFEPRVQQAYWWIANRGLGKLSVGQTGTSTNDFDEINTANVLPASRPWSLQPISDYYLTGIDLPFDGQYASVVRYDTPVFGGFTASASWGASVDATASDGTGDTWDVALRYAGEFSGVRLAGGVGYRKSTDLPINLVGVVQIAIPTGDVKTLLAVASAKHEPSGLFLSAYYANQDWQDLSFKLKSLHLQGGVEQKLFAVGATTFYGEWLRLTIDPDGGTSTDVDVYGLGLVQNVEPAAMDLYLGWRRYQDVIGTEDIDTVMGGARIQF